MTALLALPILCLIPLCPILLFFIFRYRCTGETSWEIPKTLPKKRSHLMTPEEWKTAMGRTR